MSGKQNFVRKRGLSWRTKSWIVGGSNLGFHPSPHTRCETERFRTHPCLVTPEARERRGRKDLDREGGTPDFSPLVFLRGSEPQGTEWTNNPGKRDPCDPPSPRDAPRGLRVDRDVWGRVPRTNVLSRHVGRGGVGTERGWWDYKGASENDDPKDGFVDAASLFLETSTGGIFFLVCV